MIARGFKSVVWVGAVGSAALGCYMLSLQVATERSELAKVEHRIIVAKQEIRSLQTELGTRGRLSQLEQWNTDVLALSAPASAQFLNNEFTLARLERHEPTAEESVPSIQMASAEKQAGPQAAGPAATAPTASPPAAAQVRLVQAIAQSPAPQKQPALRQASFSAPMTSQPARRVDPQPSRGVDAQTARRIDGQPARRIDAQPARRIDSRLADEIGAAARAEKKAGSAGAP